MKPFSVKEIITTRESETFKLYLKEISVIKLFTPEEEKLCAIKAHTGDKEALDELIKRNLRFVVSVAKQYAGSTAPLEDLVNEGNSGLVEAAKRFEPARGFKFISYAVWWIRRNILNYINDNSRMIRLPQNKNDDLASYNKRVNRLEQKLGRNIDILEIIDEYDGQLTKEDIEFLQNLNLNHVSSLDKPVSDEMYGYYVYDTVEDKSCLSTDHLVIAEDIAGDLNKLLGHLNPDYIKVINMLYGLNGELPSTLTEIGTEMGLSRETIRQMKEISLKILKKSIKEKEVIF